MCPDWDRAFLCMAGRRGGEADRGGRDVPGLGRHFCLGLNGVLGGAAWQPPLLKFVSVSFCGNASHGSLDVPAWLRQKTPAMSLSRWLPGAVWVARLRVELTSAPGPEQAGRCALSRRAAGGALPRKSRRHSPAYSLERWENLTR